MSFFVRFLFNLIILFVFGLITFFLFPEITKVLFYIYGSLFGPGLIILAIIVAALPIRR
jgi:uncharacterized membrane protein YhaH (DUF805 family)